MSEATAGRPEDTMQSAPAAGSAPPERAPAPGDSSGGPAPGEGSRRRRRGARGGKGRSKGGNQNQLSPPTPADGAGAPAASNGSGAKVATPSRRGAGGGAPAAGSSPAADAAGPGAAAGGVGTGDPVFGDARPPAPPGRRPQIGDTRPAPAGSPPTPASGRSESRRRRRRGGKGGGDKGPVQAVLTDAPVEVDEETLERRRGRERKGRPVGRYLMVVHVQPQATQIAVLEGRALIEHYVSRPADDANQIDGNIYLGRVQNVLPGMEAAFVDIGTPKNAVLYRGDVRFDADDVEGGGDGGPKPTRGRLPGAGRDARIEHLLKNGQTVLCQVTKNPIGTKGARLTQEVSIPGRFVVLIPNSDTYGISKRLPDEERKRLRRILDDIRPAGHGLIVRTAAEGATADELRRDVGRLTGLWQQIEQRASSSRVPSLLYREPDMAVRVIREEFNREYRGVVIDDRRLYEEVRDYVASISPELADRVEYAGDSDDPLPVFERFHIHEQIHKALDRKVWLPSGGSLIIERTEALTVIDVNTGKNVGSSNLEETVFRNNLEAAEEIAHQLRLRDIGGIIVIDFIDMEITGNRAKVISTFREALARDKTRTQVFDISELGLVEMTRKRISEGLVESFSQTCPTCGGRGIVFDQALL
jgi:ribonuclease E